MTTIPLTEKFSEAQIIYHHINRGVQSLGPILDSEEALYELTHDELVARLNTVNAAMKPWLTELSVSAGHPPSWRKGLVRLMQVIDAVVHIPSEVAADGEARSFKAGKDVLEPRPGRKGPGK